MDKSALAIPTMAKLGLAAAGAVWMGVVTSSLVALADNQLRMIELMGKNVDLVGDLSAYTWSATSKSVDLVGNLASIAISTEGRLTALENSVESGNTPPVSPPLRPHVFSNPRFLSSRCPSEPRMVPRRAAHMPGEAAYPPPPPYLARPTVQ